MTDPYGRLLVVVDGDEYLRTVALLRSAGMKEKPPGKFPGGFLDVAVEVSPYTLVKDEWIDDLTFLATANAAFVFKPPKGKQWNRR